MMQDSEAQETTEISVDPLERRMRWLGRAKGKPPEWLATFVESPQAGWVVVTEEGEKPHEVRRSAYLEEPAELPFWAFVVAKAYLEDVGEWPLYGMNTEMALDTFIEGGELDPASAVRQILATVKPVWPDLEVVFVGRERG
ncbi:MAG: hypothetical protein HQL52_18815 [Magnetococcales bacterium]|nr:hypothetical protein [Magnetococcales bacterium]